MKSKYLLLLGCLLLGCLLLPVSAAVADITNVTPDSATSASAPAANEEQGFSGKVTEVLNSADYTYVYVDTGSKKLWAVTTTFPVKAGERVTVGPGTAMPDFHSKTLNRSFDVIYFVGSITVARANGADMSALPPGHPAMVGGSLPPGHPSMAGAATTPKFDLSNIKKAEGGKTIQEIYAGKSELANNTVSVRGKVVKYNPMILGKNWLHIEDGSGSASNHDNNIAVTSKDPAALGDTVLVTGIVHTNRDFGAGYKYSVIIEDAKVTVE